MEKSESENAIIHRTGRAGGKIAGQLLPIARCISAKPTKPKTLMDTRVNRIMMAK